MKQYITANSSTGNMQLVILVLNKNTKKKSIGIHFSSGWTKKKQKKSWNYNFFQVWIFFSKKKHFNVL